MSPDATQPNFAGSQWIRASLAAGQRLSESLLLRRFLDVGSAVLLGAASDIAIAIQIDAAESIRHLTPNIHEDGRRILFELLFDVDQNGLLVVEDDVRRANDPALTQFTDDEICTFATNVYHVHAVNDLASPSALGEFLGKSSFGFPLNGFLIGGLTSGSTRSLVQSGDFMVIADHCRFTFHAIFDGDAIITWVPEDLMALFLGA